MQQIEIAPQINYVKTLDYTITVGYAKQSFAITVNSQRL